MSGAAMEFVWVALPFLIALIAVSREEYDGD